MTHQYVSAEQVGELLVLLAAVPTSGQAREQS